MQEQIFLLTIVYTGNSGTQVIKGWLKEILIGKVTRYMGVTVDSLHSTPHGLVIKCSARIAHNNNVSVEMMRNYLDDVPSPYKVTEISKR